MKAAPTARFAVQQSLPVAHGPTARQTAGQATRNVRFERVGAVAAMPNISRPSRISGGVVDDALHFSELRMRFVLLAALASPLINCSDAELDDGTFTLEATHYDLYAKLVEASRRSRQWSS